MFDAWGSVPGRPGVFDPTGPVKGWAVARAARRLAGLDERGLDWAIDAGGDVLARCAVGAGGQDPAGGQDLGAGRNGARVDRSTTARGAWHVAIEDPTDRSRVLARVPVHDGAVATSGTAARGAHILDPRTGVAATEIVQATVVGPSLLWSDVWATMLVALGPEAETRSRALHGTSGLLVYADGATSRWANPL